MTPRIDHLVWAAPELDAAAAELEVLTGVRPADGGAHPGAGSRNAMLGLEDRSYVEVLAPDPAQRDIAGPATRMARLPRASLFTFAVATTRLELVGKAVEAAGLGYPGITPMSRRLPSGRLVRWRLLMPAGHPYGPVVPFFIDWGDSPHPSETSPAGGRLAELSITHPEAWALRSIFDRLEVGVEVRAGDPAMVATLETPKGRVTLASDYGAVDAANRAQVPG